MGRILELLVATFQPLTPKEITNVLRVQGANLEQGCDFQNRMKGLGNFPRYGKDNTVTLYHLSLTEWLTIDNGRNEKFYVSRKIGHNTLCDFYFKGVTEGGKRALLKYSLPLAQHIAYGGWKEVYVEKFLRFLLRLSIRRTLKVIGRFCTLQPPLITQTCLSFCCATVMTWIPLIILEKHPHF